MIVVALKNFIQCMLSHAVFHSEWPVYSHFGKAEEVVFEYFGFHGETVVLKNALREALIRFHNQCDAVVVQIHALVAYVLAALDKALGSVNKLYLAAAAHGLAL